MRGMGFRMPCAGQESAHPVSPREQLSVSPDDWLLTFVGELSKRKNQIFLIRALERLRREGLPVRLMLVGEGTEREALEAEVGRLGLAQSVFLVGNREPVFPYLSAADLYVSASRSEGLFLFLLLKLLFKFFPYTTLFRSMYPPAAARGCPSISWRPWPAACR